MTKKKILVINGHPDPQSYGSALSQAYLEGASGSTTEVQLLELNRLKFQLNLQYGYRQRTELEPDLLKARELIQWADHLVLIYPTWWGSTPALLKGFIDRVFLPGFAFQFKEGSSAKWDKLLSGKSAHLIVTSDTPSWLNRLMYRRAGLMVMKRNTLQFCGINPVQITEINPVSSSSAEFRTKWLEKVKKLGSIKNK
ncbi:NADPH-quinone reductase [Paenibacillus swuensis]|uniref:NADPH-quinone reductase n=1 Tax=Paenibacillus swuensis TaxID=1178515 RepID=A0A172TN68_9BACL|nr:NAD(P)H-dependent oxidoreductase [Paenibacillus swuensis]ANE48416.1 NADPH-quinone reductase [Paenibacillus swuensis]